MGSPGLELKQDLAFERREGRFQRVGWGVMFGVMIAALAGVFAVGPLSGAEATTADGRVSLAYARFARVGASTELGVSVDASLAPSGTFRISLSRTFIDRTTIDAIQPEPDTVVAHGDALTYTFSTGTTGGAFVTFDLTPQEAGWIPVVVDVDGAEVLTVRQLVYP